MCTLLSSDRAFESIKEIKSHVYGHLAVVHEGFADDGKT